MAELLTTGRPVRDREVMLERPDGTRRTIIENLNPLFDEDGSLIGGVNCFQDITARKAAEARLEQRERWYRDLLQALPAAIYTTDAEGRITFFNRACVEFAGRTPKIGEMWCVTWKLFWPDGTPLAHEDCPMAIALRENRPVRDVEAIAERPDGSRICFMPYPTPLRDETGGLLGAVNMLVDITTRKQAEERMMLLTQEVDHRSNNLLAVIQAMLRLTKADTRRRVSGGVPGPLERARQCAAAVLGVALDRRQHPDHHPGRAAALRRYDSARQHPGDDVRLPAALAQAIAVSVHELATNAAKYGALPRDGGRVELTWTLLCSSRLAGLGRTQRAEGEHRHRVKASAAS